ncbi:hypothetical protein BJ508DRAFT_379926 [Ascobolus immersus RN42]|uniref:Uncharacterized protein n=1 Tax=Ascobolus immersus RN42 TaxID=1160509 RepID=A0A3N4HUM8_ASCIM|nr:hypothetical protein BJ508DRAFT_379926 [Ascobolus immersus RN42]
MPTNTVSLSAPYPLFALSQPTAPTDTNNNSKKKNIPTIRPISTAAVVAAPLGAKQRKRKRTEGEVVAGVDGEGVNIYNAATTQIVSAYALPPATKFSAAPVSLRTNAGRKTYAAVSAPQPRIVGLRLSSWCLPMRGSRL